MTPRRRLGGGQMDFDSSDMAFWDDFGDQMGRKMNPRLDLGKTAEVICAIVDFERPYNVFSWFWLVQEFQNGFHMSSKSAAGGFLMMILHLIPAKAPPRSRVSVPIWFFGMILETKWDAK